MTAERNRLKLPKSINTKADEIESYVLQIITASREDFLSLEVEMGEFYLSELISKIKLYYTEKATAHQNGFFFRGKLYGSSAER